MKKVVLSLILLLFLCIKPYSIFSAEYNSDFRAEYFLTEQGKQLVNSVKFNIKIIHNQSDIYVKKFSLIFPKYFTIKNITASDDKGEITPIINDDQEQIKIDLQFNNPETGKGSVNNFYLNFIQDNLFKVNGNVWEVILPTIENLTEGSYTVIVNLPQTSDKKISIAKPRPDQINGNQLVWINPQIKTIYAVFGDKQIYQTKLTYNLSNSKLIPAYTEIAFPPDSSLQKVYVNQIEPKPNLISVDADGNYLGRYNLNPKEIKKVVFDGTIVVSVSPISDYLNYSRKQIVRQKNYLLTAKKYWQLDSPEKFSNLDTAKDIYQYTVKTLNYDYKKVSSKTGRVGAIQALKNPNQAVCTEFTDLFIALAREKGIFSREIEGYGFSADPQLRPLSFISDLLHAWPEYYDQDNQIWTPVDPTWENTSGIDYYSSFDLNHIVLAIHGKDSDYPYPAGTYKTGNSKDIFINPTDQIPNEINKLNFQINDLKKVIYDKKNYQINLEITNLGNTFSYANQIKIKSDRLTFAANQLVIDQIAPLQTQKVVINFTPNQVYTKKASKLTLFSSDNKIIFDQPITILPAYYGLAIKFSFLSLILFLLLITFRYAKKRRR